MEPEAAEAPAVVRRLLVTMRGTFANIGARLRAAPPAVVVTCGRGSSDHAATYAKYLIETMTGTPTASAALSVASLYDAPAAAPGAQLCLAIRSEEHTSELQSLMRISYAVFCLKKKKKKISRRHLQ